MNREETNRKLGLSWINFSENLLKSRHLERYLVFLALVLINISNCAELNSILAPVLMYTPWYPFNRWANERKMTMILLYLFYFFYQFRQLNFLFYFFLGENSCWAFLLPFTQFCISFHHSFTCTINPTNNPKFSQATTFRKVTDTNCLWIRLFVSLQKLASLPFDRPAKLKKRRKFSFGKVSSQVYRSKSERVGNMFSGNGKVGLPLCIAISVFFQV